MYSEEKLFKILEENFLQYRVLNGGYHIQIFDGDEIWNFYPTSGKFHNKNNSVRDVGIKKLLNYLKIEPDSINSVQIKVDGKVEKLSDYQIIIFDGKVCIPFEVGFSIIYGKYSISTIADQHIIYVKNKTLVTFCSSVILVNSNNNEEIEI